MLILRLILIVIGLGFLLWLYRYTKKHPKESSERQASTAWDPKSISSELDIKVDDSTSQPVAENGLRNLSDRFEQPQSQGDRQGCVLSVSLRFPDGGIDLMAMEDNLSKLGLTLGTDRVYHHVDAAGETAFSVANLYEPGYLSPLPPETAIHGLVFFFSDSPGEKATGRLDRMLGSAHELAHVLDGRLEDSSHHPLTAARTLQLKMRASGATRA